MCRWLLALVAIALPCELSAQTLSGRDSSALGRALATYILAHPDVPLGGDFVRLVLDTTSGTITGSVGTAFRAIAADRWLAFAGAGDVVQLHFDIPLALYWGDSVTVDGVWNRCQAGASAGNGRAIHYRVIRADSGWKVVSHDVWLLGRVICGVRRGAR